MGLLEGEVDGEEKGEREEQSAFFTLFVLLFCFFFWVRTARRSNIGYVLIPTSPGSIRIRYTSHDWTTLIINVNPTLHLIVLRREVVHHRLSGLYFSRAWRGSFQIATTLPDVWRGSFTLRLSSWRGEAWVSLARQNLHVGEARRGTVHVE